MSRRFLALNVVLLAAAVGAAASIVRPPSEPGPRSGSARARPTAAPAAGPRPDDTAQARVTPGANAVIASRNLFSPTRTEAPPTPVAALRQAPPMPKPNLFGVVLREGTPIASLEDPMTNRVSVYPFGYALAAGTR